MKWQWVRYTVLMSLTGASLAVGQMAAAQDAPQNGEQLAQAAQDEQPPRPTLELEGLQVVGSRLPGRSAEDSPVPVDVIDGDSFRNYGIRDMDSLLSANIPSYNITQNAIGDVNALVRPAKLRGLPPDSTLVLVNGKRRHRSAAITTWSFGLAQGSHGVDVGSIPSIALKRVEVLRDGAGAQYGSDAVAGVMNFVLRDAPQGGTLEARWGQHYHGDGDLVDVAGNIGLPLTDRGFANFSFEYTEADATSRSVQRDDARALIEAGNTHVRRPATQIWGAQNLNYDYKFFGNLGLDLGDHHKIYAFGNYAERQIEDTWYYRNPNTRHSLFSNDGGQTVLVADLTDDGRSGNCPTVNIVDHLPDPAGLAAVAANPNCFALNQRFPGGFTPRIEATGTDWSIAFGLRGTLYSATSLLDGWHYDMSAVFGQHRIDITTMDTVNLQLAHLKMAIPTEYKPRAYAERDRVFNLDLSRLFDFGLFYSPLNVAFGLEYREEEFEIEAGEPNSYAVVKSLVHQGVRVGSDGYQGVPPENAGVADRGSFAAYLDLETDVFEDVLFAAAGRYENYEQIGDSLDGKLAARWNLFGDYLALRGSINTGFRAPTVGQTNYIDLTTDVAIDPDTGGVTQIDRLILPADDPLSRRKGSKPLKPETSITFSVGTVLNLGGLSITIDYYNTEVRNQIALTGRLPITQDDVVALAPSGVTARAGGFIQYFTNDYDRTTQGVDVVATYPLELLGGSTLFTFAGNWNNTEIDSFNPAIIDPAVQLRQLEDSEPQFRFSLMADHVQGAWRFLTRLHYYDDFTELQGGFDPSEKIYAHARLLVDLEVSYTFADAVTIAVGAQNLFDTYPTRNPYAGGAGQKYPVISPYGFSGGFYYLRAGFEWY